jgi:hypothetical protein
MSWSLEHGQRIDDGRNAQDQKDIANLDAWPFI